MRSLGLASLLTLIALPSTVRADERLVLQLPPLRTQSQSQSTPEQSAPAERPAQKPPAAAQSAPDRSGSANRLPGNQRVVGRLGVSTKTVGIHRSHSSSSRTISKISAGTYLAITDQASGWYGIMMTDHTTGWLPSANVNVLNWEVVTNRVPDRHSSGSYAPPLGDSPESVLREAYKYLGVPYKYGGTSLTNGLDCSAFVQHCFSTIGVNLPRTAHEQAEIGTPISTDQLQPSDRLYFASRDGRITHTGIYVGDGYFIHSSSSHHGVAVSKLSDPLYSRMFAGARR